MVEFLAQTWVALAAMLLIAFGVFVGIAIMAMGEHLVIKFLQRTVKRLEAENRALQKPKASWLTENDVRSERRGANVTIVSDPFA